MLIGPDEDFPWIHIGARFPFLSFFVKMAKIRLSIPNFSSWDSAYFVKSGVKIFVIFCSILLCKFGWYPETFNKVMAKIHVFEGFSGGFMPVTP